MIQKTRAIVLHSFKYGESGMIVRMLTPNFGMLSFLAHGARKARSKNKASLFQPLSILDVVAYIKPGDQLQHIREVRCPHPFTTIHSDIRKTSLALFMAEILLNSIKHQDIQADAYNFVEKAVYHLDSEQVKLAEFHIVFLLQLSKYLGFYPGRNYSASHCYFNLREGSYQAVFDGELNSLDQEESKLFFALSDIPVGENPSTSLSHPMRMRLLQKIIDYYRYHMEGFREIKSLRVLETVFN